VNGIPLLTCHLHQGLLIHGEHLAYRCSGWSDDLHRQQGWAPRFLAVKKVGHDGRHKQDHQTQFCLLHSGGEGSRRVGDAWVVNGARIQVAALLENLENGNSLALQQPAQQRQADDQADAGVPEPGRAFSQLLQPARQLIAPLLQRQHGQQQHQ